MIEYTGPHDYFNKDYVEQWEREAFSKRPFRIEFFDLFVAEIQKIDEAKVLELGSGPGFLAEYILKRCPVADYHLFDFSPHMLELSQARLAAFADRTQFHQGSFLDETWWQTLPDSFDAIISLQALHEVRRAERIPPLYTEMKKRLKAGGIVMIADQINNEARHEKHLLTQSEHLAAFCRAGFQEVREVYAAGDLAMFGAGS